MVDGGKRTVNSVHTLPGLENLIVKYNPNGSKSICKL